MTQIIMVGASTTPPPPGQGIPLAPGVVLGVSGAVQVSAPDPTAPTPNPTFEAHNLRPLVEAIFRTDLRFVGLSKFIVTVRIFWSLRFRLHVLAMGSSSSTLTSGIPFRKRPARLCLHMKSGT